MQRKQGELVPIGEVIADLLIWDSNSKLRSSASEPASTSRACL